MGFSSIPPGKICEFTGRFVKHQSRGDLQHRENWTIKLTKVSNMLGLLTECRRNDGAKQKKFPSKLCF